MSSSIRILCVDDDRLLLELVKDRLSSVGFQVDCISEPTRVVPTAKALHPHLILMDRQMPVLEGQEVMRSLQAFPETRDIPVAFLTGTCTEDHLLAVLRMGAVDVMVKPFSEDHVRRIQAIVEEVAGEHAPVRPSLWDNLRAVYRRNVRAGALVLNRGTPFEGRIRFQNGNFLGAEYGGMQGEAAAAEMLLVEDGTWTFEENLSHDNEVRVLDEEEPDTTSSRLRLAEGYVPTALIVSQDARYRELLSTALQAQGFRATPTNNPLAAFDLAVQSPPDMAIIQLTAGGLDGWGLLRHLRDDHRTREIPIACVDTEAPLLQTFHAARLGAQLFFEKHSLPEVIAGGCHDYLAERRQVIQLLKERRELNEVKLQRVGAQWLLRALADFRLSGRLQVADEWGSYRFIFYEGRVVDASTGISRKLATGVAAVAALTVARDAEATFFLADDLTPAVRAPQPVEKLLEQAASALNRLESQVTERWLGSAKTFVVNAALYDLYQRFAQEGPHPVARAICEKNLSPAELIASGMASDNEVHQVLRDLLRRRVIEFLRDA